MKRFGLSCLAVLLALTTSQIAAAKGGKTGGKIGGKKAPEKVKGPAPIAKAAEIKELKGDFTWGMTPQAVKDKLFAKIDANYKDRLEKSRLDPAKNDGIRQQIKADKDRISKSYVKFEGKTPGWEVSIIDEEFVPNNNESMLIYQEVKQKRYFFFNGDSLFKMFIAFDKEVVQGKSFTEFGEMMQAKFGKAQPVYRTVVLRGQKDNVLDTYLWRSSEGDGLRLVDRSKFYDVYCLVVYDRSVADRQAEVKKNNAAKVPTGSFIDSVISDKPNDRDENDNIVDRLTGKEVLKPGERRGNQQNIKVPSPTGEMKAEDKGF
jgi:hypothetical protein